MIININDKTREIKDLEIIQHIQTDIVNNEDISVEYVQYTVIGKHGEWIDWMPLNEFRDQNPEVNI